MMKTKQEILMLRILQSNNN